MSAFPDGKALQRAREAKGWTQEQLSEHTKPNVAVSTISRIERGQQTRVRRGTLKNLCQALGVGLATLCKTTERETEVVKLRMDSAVRNACTLVGRRYRVDRDQIIAAAPFLFFIAAEQSLQDRQRRITELRERAASLFDSYLGIPHLPQHYPVDEGALQSEENSIKARDLFGELIAEDERSFVDSYDSDYNNDESNPFVTFLRDALAKATSSGVLTRWSPFGSPFYKICAEEAGAIVGNDSEATDAILRGSVELHKLPDGSPAERAAWVRAVDAKARDEFTAELFGQKLTGKASNTEASS